MPRTKSEFESKQKITISLHPALLKSAEVSPAAIAGVLERDLQKDFSVRVQHRQNRTGSADRVASSTISIAPKGYEFPRSATSASARISRDTTELIKRAAAEQGKDADELIRELLTGKR